MSKAYYIGLMSGTSVDAIDAALVDLSETQPVLIATHRHDIPDHVRQAIVKLCHPSKNELNDLGQTDVLVGQLFAEAACALLKKAKVNADSITAIGSHGQTVRHHPDMDPSFTVQIGDPNTIAARTHITTVADFRRKDIANGGQGAPFVPVFHDIIRQRSDTHIMLNIGGIANLTYLPENKHESILGFDTGPGNTLIDLWCQQHQGKPCDINGAWAKTGKINEKLLSILLDDAYFKKTGPKSTGREYFNEAWLIQHLKNYAENIKPEDIQATLTELTAVSIADAINHISNNTVDVIVCGGGAHNKFLMQRLKQALSPRDVKSSSTYRIDPDWIEAMAFAWFAKQTLEKKPIDLTRITGAKKSAILGGIYYP